jgi:hypothetical protein
MAHTGRQRKRGTAGGQGRKGKDDQHGRCTKPESIRKLLEAQVLTQHRFPGLACVMYMMRV